MFVPKRVFILLTAVMLCVAGCQDKQSAPSVKGQKVLATVNGAPITADDINFQLQKGHGSAPKVNRSLDDVINQELLYQQGLKLGLDKAPDYRALLAKLDKEPRAAKRMEMARRVFNTQIAANVDIHYQDVREYYDKNADRIATGLHLLMIRFDDGQRAAEALKRIRNGETFEAVARAEMGSAPVKGREPWDLGFVKWEDVPVDFEDTIYAMKSGEVSNVLGTQQAGFQIVKLLESRKGARIGFDSVHAALMNRLRDLKLLESYNQYVANLRKNANISKI